MLSGQSPHLITSSISLLSTFKLHASQSALNKETDKGQALQKMEAFNIDTLPVVDEKKRFVGVVNRSCLTASLLIDVAKNLEKK